MADNYKRVTPRGDIKSSTKPLTPEYKARMEEIMDKNSSRSSVQKDFDAKLAYHQRQMETGATQAIRDQGKKDYARIRAAQKLKAAQ